MYKYTYKVVPGSCNCEPSRLKDLKSRNGHLVVIPTLVENAFHQPRVIIIIIEPGSIFFPFEKTQQQWSIDVYCYFCMCVCKFLVALLVVTPLTCVFNWLDSRGQGGRTSSAA